VRKLDNGSYQEAATASGDEHLACDPSLILVRVAGT
jgi:hypothetical protein